MELKELVEKLNEKGYHAQLAADGQEACQMALEILRDAKTIGKGGSVTIREIGLLEALTDQGKTIYSADTAASMGLSWSEQAKKAMTADAYLTSANAVTQQGDIINIDGRGNRVGAIIYGPDMVVMVVGKNKISKGPHEAIARIKKVACPKNAKRLGYDTPCGVTGVCQNCKHAHRMCKVTMRMEYALPDKDMYVILVDQELGY